MPERSKKKCDKGSNIEVIDADFSKPRTLYTIKFLNNEKVNTEEDRKEFSQMIVKHKPKVNLLIQRATGNFQGDANQYAIIPNIRKS